LALADLSSLGRLPLSTQRRHEVSSPYALLVQFSFAKAVWLIAENLGELSTLGNMEFNNWRNILRLGLSSSLSLDVPGWAVIEIIAAITNPNSPLTPRSSGPDLDTKLSEVLLVRPTLDPEPTCFKPYAFFLESLDFRIGWHTVPDFPGNHVPLGAGITGEIDI
jgi:hypothetical protein